MKPKLEPRRRTPADAGRRGLMVAAVAAASALASPVRAAMPAAEEASLFPHNFDGMQLVDQDNKRFAFGALQGQVLLVNFVYTGCSSVCPVQTHDLAEVLRAMPEQERSGIHFVSISLDPQSDTPAALKAYAQRMSADFTHWSFVTGKPADLERLSERLRLFRPGAKKPDDHATALWLVDARGRLLQRLQGNPVDRLRVARELNAMKNLAAAPAGAGLR